MSQPARLISAVDTTMDEVYQLPARWLPISIAPADIALEVGVMDNLEVHTLIFPVRKSGDAWIDASTGKLVYVEPTHWRKWT